MARQHFQSVDEYISSFPKEIQDILQKLRLLMHEEMPEAQVVTSYQIPCFKLNGKYVIYFAAFENHISLYPIPKGDTAFQKKIAPFVKGKGTISFRLESPIPYPLVKEIVQTAVKQRMDAE